LLNCLNFFKSVEAPVKTSRQHLTILKLPSVSSTSKQRCKNRDTGLSRKRQDSKL